MKKVIGIFLAVIVLGVAFWGLIKLNKSNLSDNISQTSQALQGDKSASSTRASAVAGSFYPSDKNKLDSDLSSFLDEVAKLKISGKPRILIVPHAGISYSGGVAASGFKQLEGMDNLRVIILGVGHNEKFDYAAIDDNAYWQTPLGGVEVDTDFATTLVNGISIRADKSVHTKEHSLEVEVIFLQKVLKNFKIVPILLGQTSGELQSSLAQKLAYNFDDSTVLVISSDLSHYPDWEDANVSDSLLVDSIVTGKVKSFKQTLSDIAAKNYANEVTAACGQDAIKVGLKMAEILGITRFEKIKYENSGDVTGDKSRVVGYASIVGYSDNIDYTPLVLNADFKKEALEIARITLDSYISNKKVPNIKLRSDLLQEPLGVFTTLTINGQLRGCIGQFEPVKPLYKVIQETTISSATEDRRFRPVMSSELKDIKIEISVMTPRRKVANWRDIRLGIDGVVVQKGANGGTFLPQVATDNNWDLEEFLGELCSQKAGLEVNCYKDPAVTIYSYEVTKFGEE